MNIFEHSFTVKLSDIDSLNHVNNVVYLKWINMISGMHWHVLTNNKINSQYFWIVSRHEIDYLKPAFLDDKITIKTWIEVLKGVKSIRCVEMYSDNVLLAKGRTTWILMNSETKKINRIPNEIIKLFN